MNIQDLKKEMDLWADSANQRIVSSTNGLALEEAMRAQYIIDPNHTADCLSYKAFYDSYGCISLNNAGIFFYIIKVSCTLCMYAMKL